MALVDDVLSLPLGVKLLVGFMVLMGGSIKIPILDISIGEIIFFPITLIFSFFGISFTWGLFVVLYAVIMLLIFTAWIYSFVKK